MKGLFIGKSHKEGGIPSQIKETGRAIEIEGDEYYICKSAYNSDQEYNYIQKTNKQILDDIYTKHSCKLNQSVMSSGDFITCKLVVKDNGRKNRRGTVKSILNEMQGEKACKVENRNNILQSGGEIKSNWFEGELSFLNY